MAALTSERDTLEIAGRAPYLSLPVKASTKIYQGALVAVDASGFAIPAKKAASLKAAGRAEETIDNSSGADGDVSIRVKRGCFIWENSGTAENVVGRANLLSDCYMEDDKTVTALSTGSSVAGKVIGVTDHGVLVETW